MTTVIDTLVQMASDASIQQTQDIEQLLAENSIEASIATAIINKDVTALERQLDVSTDIICAVFPAEDDDESEEKDKDKESREERNNNVIGF